MAEPPDLGLVLLQFFIVALLQYQVSSFHILLYAGEKILRQGDASKIGYEACESGGPHLIRFRGSEIDTGGNTHQGCQADGIQQDPDPVVKKFPGLVEMPCKYSVDTVPDQKVQEGWHYELESAEDDLTINGVVYNEMKGAFSSPDDVLYREIMNSLYPDTSYGVESGGDPDVIPELTYEEFLAFHQKYYHPSNSYIYLYGNMDMAEKLQYIDKTHYVKRPS